MSPVAICFGEALIDVYPDQEAVAGAPLHVAVHLARAGFPAFVLTRVGRDPDGDRIVRTLERHGVGTALVERDPRRPTGRVTVHDAAGPDGPAYTIHEGAAFDAIEGPDALPPHDVFYYGTLASREETSRLALGRLLAGTSAPWRVLDVNLRPPHVHAGALALAMTRATLVKVSASESRTLPGILRTTAGPRSWFAHWPDLAWICITRGEEGADLLHRDGGAWSVGAPSVAGSARTVGAGDAFLAGLLAPLVRGEPPEAALSAANRLVASILARADGLPPPPS